MQMESTKCPVCSKDLYTAVCPNCGRISASAELPTDEVDDSDGGWVREFSVLWYMVKIRSGSDDRFVETGWRAGSFAQTTTYSRGWWLFLNLGVIVLMALFGALLGIIMTLDPEIRATFPMLVVFAFTAVYSVIFYYITFVPPKS